MEKEKEVAMGNLDFNLSWNSQSKARILKFKSEFWQINQNSKVKYKILIKVLTLILKSQNSKIYV